MIIVENITKSFSNRKLFEGVSFKINSRLFRLMAGEESVFAAT